MGTFNPFVNPAKRPMVLNGNQQIVTEGVRALEALTDEALGALYPDYDKHEIAIAEIEIWENMPIRCCVQPDMFSEWITWTGSKWIREEDAQ